ncbi:MAG: Ig-like domain-containing protein, partial [candidate division WOR-3 bacterium]
AGDFSGNPILGAMLNFSTTLGTLDPPMMITNSEGEASVYLRSDQGTQTATATVTVSHPFASWPLSISVKFYAAP